MHSILKIVFLEIQNKAIRPVLSGPVTYAIVHCFVICGMCMRERLLSIQYKEAYDRELMQLGNTMQ